MFYMYYVDHRDLSRVLHVICGLQRPGSCVTCIMWTTETWVVCEPHVLLCEPQRPGVVCYMYHVDHRDLGRVLHVLCEPHGPGVVCYMYYVDHRDLVVCYMYYVDHRDLSRVLHVLCGPQRSGSCVTCIM